MNSYASRFFQGMGAGAVDFLLVVPLNFGILKLCLWAFRDVASLPDFSNTQVFLAAFIFMALVRR